MTTIKRSLRWLIGLCLLAMLVPAQAGIAIAHWTSASGARVYFVENHLLPMVDVQVDFSAGIAYDPPDKAGLSALVQGLLDTGAGDLGEEAIAERLADLGAQLSGHADADRAWLAVRTLSSAAERDGALELMRTLLSAPTFPDAALAREKSRLVAAIKEADTKPDMIAAKRFAQAVFGAHAYGRAASVGSVQSLSRDDLLAFHRRFYARNRAVVSIVGDLTRAQAEAVAEQLTAGLPQSDAPVGIDPVAPSEAATVQVAHPANQSHILIGEPVMRRGDADFFPLQVGNYILGGGGFVSRLTKEVRVKRGYAYSVYSYFMPLREPGAFQIGLQTQREQSGAALKVVDDTLAAFLANGPTEAEVAQAKRNLVDGFSLRLDSNRKILDSIAVIGFYGLPLDWLEAFPARVEKVTAAQVKDAFRRRIRPEQLVKVIVAGS